MLQKLLMLRSKNEIIDRCSSEIKLKRLFVQDSCDHEFNHNKYQMICITVTVIEQWADLRDYDRIESAAWLMMMIEETSDVVSDDLTEIEESDSKILDIEFKVHER